MDKLESYVMEVTALHLSIFQHDINTCRSPRDAVLLLFFYFCQWSYSQGLLLALSTRTVCISQSGTPGGNSSSYWGYLFRLCLKNRHIITVSLCTPWAYCEETLGQTQWFSDFLNSTGRWNTMMFWITGNLGATLGWLESIESSSGGFVSLFTSLLHLGRDLWCMVVVWQDFP